MSNVCVPADASTSKRKRLDAATYRVQEAADLAGVSVRTIWRWIDARKVPGVIRVGKIVRISKSPFEVWLSSGGAR